MPECPAIDVVRPERFTSIRPRVEAIEAQAAAVDGHPSLNDAVWRALDHPDARAMGFLVDDVAYAHVAPGDTHASNQWIAGAVVAPAARADDILGALASRALDHVRAHGGGRVSLWLLGGSEHDDAALRAAGFTLDRELHEMRVSLPLADTPVFPSQYTIRTFEPGRDDDAWLTVNNRAFAGHAEQGDWDASTLALRMQEPWFDPSLFLLAFDAEGLAGFNWLKLHEAQPPDPERGEIFVIGVDPRTQGTGLGRPLAIAGLERVADRGVRTGMLFVAAENQPAIKLYRSLGFTVHRTDRAYDARITS